MILIMDKLPVLVHVCALGSTVSLNQHVEQQLHVSLFLQSPREKTSPTAEFIFKQGRVSVWDIKVWLWLYVCPSSQNI